ncbi:MAG: hypothetical protein PF448_07200 [Bacteroidales bacterium]|jgi:hypothetical protein|nr:hypothetical protein [Bacteroidales bacterium]
MKNLFVFLGLLLIGSFGFAQIESYNIESSKTYDDGTKTSYLILEGNVTPQVRSCFEKEVKQIDAIQMFRFYDSGNPGKCMFTASVDFSEQELESMIQRANNAYNNSKQKSKVSAQELDIMFFELVSQGDMIDEEKVKQKLLEYDFIQYVAFGNNSECKIGALKNTSEADVLDALNAVGVEVR